MTRIGNLPVSRLIAGSNTFFGYSHFSKAKDDWLKKYFSDERIAEVLGACMEEGLNAIVSGPQPRMFNAIQMAKKATGRRLNWIITPSAGGHVGPVGDTIEEQIAWCTDHDCKVCMPHTGWTDNRLLIEENRIQGLEPVLELIRKKGMGTGLSTHRPEVLIVGEKAGYDLDCYILPYNSAGFLCAVETDWTASVIRGTPKPVICIKPFAAGRVMPPTGLPFVYNSVKPIDTVCMGVLSVEEVKENAMLARQVIAGQAASAELTYSRSKQALVAAAPKTSKTPETPRGCAGRGKKHS
jgi:hypothetical protein